MDFTDPKGMGHRSVVGVEDPGLVRRITGLDGIGQGIHTEETTGLATFEHVSLGIAGEHETWKRRFRSSDSDGVRRQNSIQISIGFYSRNVNSFVVYQQTFRGRQPGLMPSIAEPGSLG